MRSNFDPRKYGDFTRGEIIYIIQLSAALQSNDEIEEKFHKLTKGQKSIKGTQIIEIQADFSSTIAKKSEIYLKNINGNPMAHPRIILDMCLELYKECRKKTPSHTIKISHEAYEVVEKEDLKTALAAVKLAKDFTMELKKLELEKEKANKLSPSDFSLTSPQEEETAEWETDSGIGEF